MRPPRLQLAAAALCGVAALTGCAGMSSVQYTQVRFIAASPDAPALDFYQNGAPVLYTVPFGTVSSYMPIPAGSYAYSADIAGLHQHFATTSGTLQPGAQYTILVGDIAASPQMKILKDLSTPAPAGDIEVRFVNEAIRTGAVDIYLVPPGASLSATEPIAAGISLGKQPSYITVPSGVYSVIALPAGDSPISAANALYSSNQLEFAVGSSRTIVLLDKPQAKGQGLQMISELDYDPSAS
jgi:hypothetical protein